MSVLCIWFVGQQVVLQQQLPTGKRLQGVGGGGLALYPAISTMIELDSDCEPNAVCTGT